MSNKEEISKELDEVTIDKTEDDVFEKVLSGEGLEEPKDDETGTDTSDKKVVDDPKVVEPKEDSDEVKDLKAQIAKLEKEAKGRLNDVVQSRQEKALFKSELNELKAAVSDLLSKREQTLEEDPKIPLGDTKRPIEFDDDDAAFVDLSEVKEAILAENEATKADLETLKAEREMEKLQKEFNQSIEDAISEDKDRYTEAYDSLRNMFKDLNDAVIDYQKRTGNMGENGTLEQDEAMELLDGSPEQKAFLERYPGIDTLNIARAFNTKMDLRRSLRHIADVNKIGVETTKEKETPTLDDKIKEAKQKPGSLAKSENQAGGTVDLIDRIASLDFSDIESLSDAEAAKIEAMLLNEELKGY